MGLADAMVYSRGAADDYNAWAATTGDCGWSWEALGPYFARVRRYLDIGLEERF